MLPTNNYTQRHAATSLFIPLLVTPLCLFFCIPACHQYIFLICSRASIYIPMKLKCWYAILLKYKCIAFIKQMQVNIHEATFGLWGLKQVFIGTFLYIVQHLYNIEFDWKILVSTCVSPCITPIGFLILPDSTFFSNKTHMEGEGVSELENTGFATRDLNFLSPDL